MDNTDFEHTCTELRLYAENTGELYPVVRRLVGRLARTMKQYPNVSDEVLLEHVRVDWYNLCLRAARMYKQEIKLDYNFTIPIMKTVAHEWSSDYLKRLRTGEEGLHDG